MLRSKQCGKHWESSTHRYSLSTYSVQATVHLNPQNFQDSVSALNYSEEGGGMASSSPSLLLFLLQLWWVRDTSI